MYEHLKLNKKLLTGSKTNKDSNSNNKKGEKLRFIRDRRVEIQKGLKLKGDFKERRTAFLRR